MFWVCSRSCLKFLGDKADYVSVALPWERNVVRMGTAVGGCGQEAVCFCTGAPGHLPLSRDSYLSVRGKMEETALTFIVNF